MVAKKNIPVDQIEDGRNFPWHDKCITHSHEAHIFRYENPKFIKNNHKVVFGLGFLDFLIILVFEFFYLLEYFFYYLIKILYFSDLSWQEESRNIKNYLNLKKNHSNKKINSF